MKMTVKLSVLYFWPIFFLAVTYSYFGSFKKHLILYLIKIYLPLEFIAIYVMVV